MSSSCGVDKVRCAIKVLVHESPQSSLSRLEGVQISFDGKLFAVEMNTGSDLAAVSFCAEWTSVCLDREHVALSDTVDSNKLGSAE